MWDLDDQLQAFTGDRVLLFERGFFNCRPVILGVNGIRLGGHSCLKEMQGHSCVSNTSKGTNPKSSEL